MSTKKSHRNLADDVTVEKKEAPTPSEDSAEARDHDEQRSTGAGPGANGGRILHLPAFTEVGRDRLRNVPRDILKLSSFVVADRTLNGGAVKSSKRPIDPNTGEWASSNDATTWGTAKAAARWALDNQDRAAGIGVNLLGRDFICLDLDHVFEWPDGNRTLKPGVQVFLDAMPKTFIEESASGDGLHVWFRGVLPERLRRKLENAFGPGSEIEKFDGHAGRYVLLTGKPYGELCKSIADFDDSVEQALDELHEKAGQAAVEREQNERTTTLPDKGRYDLSQMRELVKQVDPSKLGYEDGGWLDMLFIIHHVLGDEGEELACEWSAGDLRGSPNPKDDAGFTRDKFRHGLGSAPSSGRPGIRRLTEIFEAQTGESMKRPPLTDAEKAAFGEPMVEPEAMKKAKPPPPDPKPILMRSLIDTENDPPTEWLVPGLYPERSAMLTFGDSNTGKSVHELDVVMRLHYGLPINGYAGPPRSVFYLAGEGMKDIGPRMKAWRLRYEAEHGPLPDVGDRYAFVNSEPVPELVTPAGFAKLKDTLLALWQTHGHGPEYGTIDTLTSVWAATGDQDDNGELGLWGKRLVMLAEKVGCTLNVIHHPRKEPAKANAREPSADKQGKPVRILSMHDARGASALVGALDHVLAMVELHGGGVQVWPVKSRGSAKGETVRRFAIESQPLGSRNRDGDEHDAAVVVEMTESDTKSQTQKRAEAAQQAKDQLLHDWAWKLTRHLVHETETNDVLGGAAEMSREALTTGLSGGKAGTKRSAIDKAVRSGWMSERTAKNGRFYRSTETGQKVAQLETAPPLPGAFDMGESGAAAAGP